MSEQIEQESPILPQFSGNFEGKLTETLPHRNVVVMTSQSGKATEYHATTRMIAHIKDLFKMGDTVQASIKDGWISAIIKAPPKQEALL
jgi:hypothetical protein